MALILSSAPTISRKDPLDHRPLPFEISGGEVEDGQRTTETNTRAPWGRPRCGHHLRGSQRPKRPTQARATTSGRPFAIAATGPTKPPPLSLAWRHSGQFALGHAAAEDEPGNYGVFDLFTGIPSHSRRGRRRDQERDAIPGPTYSGAAAAAATTTTTGARPAEDALRRDGADATSCGPLAQTTSDWNPRASTRAAAKSRRPVHLPAA